MVEIINQHNILVEEAILKLNQLKTLVLSLNRIENTDRIKTCIANINRCIEYGNYYINDNTLYNPSVFRYDSTLVNLVDTIKGNDFGSILPMEKESEKHRLCNDLVNIVEKLLLINNKLKEI